MSQNDDDKKIDIKQALFKMINYLEKHKIILVVASTLAVIATILELVGPNKIKELVDEMTKVIETGTINMEVIASITALVIGLYVAVAVLEFICNLLAVRISLAITKKLRTDISHKINRVPLSYFNETSVGDVLSRVSNDVDVVGEQLVTCIGTFVTATLMLIGSIVMMLYTNWTMAVVAILASLLGFGFSALIMSKSQKYFQIQQDNLGKMNGFIEETYSGYDIVKIYNNDEESKERFDDINHTLYQSAFKSQFLGGLMMPLMTFVGNLGYVAVCITGAVLIIDNTISFGTIFAFMIYVRLFTQPLSQLAQVFLQVQTLGAASTRIFDFLELDEMEDECDKKTRLANVKGEVEFRDIHFGYSSDKEIIHGFTAKIKPGQKVAIVGPTGAGKTTIVNLLMRFYDVDSGEILIDKIPTKDVPRENVHEQFCMVLQDSWIFNGTIFENVRYSNENVTDEDIRKACDAAGIHHFIETLPNKYETILDESISISSGQKQQLTIARAMVQHAPMLILDEATSSVDTRTEKIIQAAMDKLMEGRTSFVIAHRLSTIKNSDIILVMKDGNIIEQGNHETLLAQKGFYFELYNSQFSTEPNA